MTELIKIEIGPGLTFDVLTAGAADAPLVLLLHGFAESFHMWRLAGCGAGRRRLPGGGAEPARLFARRAAGHRRVFELRVRSPGRRCHGHRRALRRRTGAFI